MGSVAKRKIKDIKMEHLGKRKWIIAEGYIPGKSTGPGRAFESHETACILNTGGEPANIEVTIYFTDREPSQPYRFVVKAERTFHLRFNDLTEPESIPHDTDYSALILSDVPVVVQHTRLDSRQSENALMTTIPYCE